MSNQVAAIVKGLIEHNDKYIFFGSTLDFKHHVKDALQCGVIEELEDKNLAVTALGKEWYANRLEKLPQCRATNWNYGDVDFAFVEKQNAKIKHF